MGGKDELLERASILEADSRGWFEEDEEFATRLNEVRQVEEHGRIVCQKIGQITIYVFIVYSLFGISCPL